MNLADFERRGSDSMLPAVKENEKLPIETKPPANVSQNFQNIQNTNENNSFTKIPLKSNAIPNNSAMAKEQEKTLIKEKTVLQPTTTIIDKSSSQKTVLNPKLQALFARSNSPKENAAAAQMQTNPIQNTNALLNKFNLPQKFGNKEETNIMASKGSPKGGVNPNQTTKLQEQIKQLQQEQYLLQKKNPAIYQNAQMDPKNFAATSNKPTMNYTLANKFSNNNANDPFNGMSIPTKNFADSGSPKAQITPNSKQNLGEFGKKNNFGQGNIESNIFKGKNDIGQTSANLYQNLLNQKKK